MHNFDLFCVKIFKSYSFMGTYNIEEDCLLGYYSL
jgi:hypothetical protein